MKHWQVLQITHFVYSALCIRIYTYYKSVINIAHYSLAIITLYSEDEN